MKGKNKMANLRNDSPTLYNKVPDSEVPPTIRTLLKEFKLQDYNLDHFDEELRGKNRVRYVAVFVYQKNPEFFNIFPTLRVSIDPNKGCSVHFGHVSGWTNEDNIGHIATLMSSVAEEIERINQFNQ